MQNLENKLNKNELIEKFITHVDKKISKLSSKQMDNLIKEIPHDTALLQDLLKEVEIRREYHHQKYLTFQFKAFRTFIIYIGILIALRCSFYFIAINYHLPRLEMRSTLTRKLEFFGITFIKKNERFRGYFEKISDKKHLNQSEHDAANYLMDHILLIDYELRMGWFVWVLGIIKVFFIIFVITIFRHIRRWLEEKRKRIDEKYLLLEQKLYDNINKLP
jgi:hypothetical protein